MCFSANASFGSAALLMATGAVATLRNKSKQQNMIAAIPFIFGIQQAAEGIVWRTMGPESAGSWHQFGSLIFIATAFVIWPTWLPWSVYRIEKNETRKKILKVIGIMGTGVSFLAASVLVNLEIKAYPVGHSLGYEFINLTRSWPAKFDFLLYDTPTLLPFFISSLRTVKTAGYLVFASMIVTQMMNKEAAISVWCFFAALISLYISVNILWLQKGKLS